MNKIIDPAQTLADAKEEQFAVLVAEGSNQTAAFEAVYERKSTAHACRKAKTPRVQARIEWLRTNISQEVVENIGEAKAAVAVEAVRQEAVTRQFVLETLVRNVQIAMGDKPVEIKKITKDKDGNQKVMKAEVTMRDAAAANRALQMLGEELGMWEGEGARDERDKTERAPIRTGSNEKAVAFLMRHFAGKTPAAILGRKFQKTVGTA